jgi:hypothetical protein
MPHVVLWPGRWRELVPAHPIAVAFPASSEALDALLRTERSLPRVVVDKTKLAVTDRASRCSAVSKNFGAVRHSCLLLGLNLCLVPDDPLLFWIKPIATSSPLDAGRIGYPMGWTELNEGLRCPPLKVGHFLDAFVRLTIGVHSPASLA